LKKIDEMTTINVVPSPLSNLAARIGDGVDLFIGSASFELRSLSISNHIQRQGVKRAVIAQNQTYANEIATNLEKLHNLWGQDCEDLIVSSDDPVLSFDNIRTALSADDRESPRRLVIDISTFTHELVMMFYHACATFLNAHDKVEFLYATADDYSMSQTKSSKWLSKGIKEIRSVIGFPGRPAPSRSHHLVVLAGFEENRALAVIREFEPSLVSIGYGDSSEISTGPHQETNESKVRRLRSMAGNVNEFQFSCYEPVSTEATLQQLISQYPSYNHIVAPMNTKLSTLGAARYASKNQFVQLCYAQPETYNVDDYSKPGTHYYHVAFEDLATPILNS
jgi:hypothetical protein